MQRICATVDCDRQASSKSSLCGSCRGRKERAREQAKAADGPWKPKPLPFDELVEELNFLAGTDTAASLANRLGWKTWESLSYRLRTRGREDVVTRVEAGDRWHDEESSWLPR